MSSTRKAISTLLTLVVALGGSAIVFGNVCALSAGQQVTSFGCTSPSGLPNTTGQTAIATAINSLAVTSDTTIWLPSIAVTASTSVNVAESYTFEFTCSVNITLPAEQLSCDFDPPTSRPAWLSSPSCTSAVLANGLSKTCTSQGTTPASPGTLFTTVTARATRGTEIKFVSRNHSIEITARTDACPIASGTLRGTYRANTPNTWTPVPLTNGIHYWALEPGGWQPAPGKGEVRWSSVLSDYTETHGYLTKCPGFAPVNPIGDPRVSAYLPPTWAAGSGALQFIATDSGTSFTTVVGSSVTTIANAPGLNSGVTWYFVVRQVSCVFENSECPRSQYGTR